MKSFVRRLLDRAGYEIASKGRIRTWQPRVENMKRLGFSPRVALDGGAFRGRWAAEIAGIFPGVQVVMAEPNPYLQPVIAETVRGIQPPPIVIERALGAVAGTATFNMWQDSDNDPSASLLGHVRGAAGEQVEVQVESIDAIAKRLGVTFDLIKLDLQGGELAALEGATQSLRRAEVVMLEFHCFESYVGVPLPHDLFAVMHEHGYRLYDLFDCYNRPRDGALSGGDFVFVKHHSDLVGYQGWE